MSPVYMAADIVNVFVERVASTMEPLAVAYELILVDDGSTDHSWDAVRAACQTDRRVKGVRIAGNIGQHRAIAEGLKFASGNAVVVLDCDLQDDPAYIKDLYRLHRNGFEIVHTRRSTRAFSFARNTLARLFYFLLLITRGIWLDPAVGTYSLLSRRAVDTIVRDNRIGDGYLISLKRTGLRSTHVTIAHHARPVGQSSYSLLKLVDAALRFAFSGNSKAFLLLGSAGISMILMSRVRWLPDALAESSSTWAGMVYMFLTIGGTGLLLFSALVFIYLKVRHSSDAQRQHATIAETMNL